MWNTVRTEINSQDCNNKLYLNIEGKSINDFRDQANIFNDCFVNATNINQANDTSSNLQTLNNLY